MCVCVGGGGEGDEFIYYEFFNLKNVKYNLCGIGTRLELPPFNLECMH